MNILYFISYIFLIYVFICELIYFIMKYIKKDARFEKVSFFRFLESPIKTLKGDK